MEHISFILWVCLFPIACTIDSYWSEKKRLMIGEEKPSKSIQGFTALINLILWVVVAILLF